MNRLTASAAFLLIAFSLPQAANAQSADAGCPAALADAIPDAPHNAPAGRQFAHEVESLSGAERDAVLQPLLLEGDIPGFLRHLKPVALHGTEAAGNSVTVTVCVMPDYLAIGSDDDFVRVPMGLPAAMAVARRFGFMLPTTKIVDAIYSAADVRVRPEPLPAGPQMRSTDYFVLHDQLIRQESLVRGAMPGMLLAGQKKDLVISNRLRTNPGRVAIYGWHLEERKPIQSLSTFHGENYADYSHGVRLVSAIAYVGQERRSLLEILQDARLAPAVSTEGAIPDPGALMAKLSRADVDGATIRPAGNRAGNTPGAKNAAIR